MEPVTFHVSINDGPEQAVTVKTGIYQHAAVAALAILGMDDLPAVVKIWIPHLTPEYGPYYYIVENNEFMGLVVKHAVPQSAQK